MLHLCEFQCYLVHAVASSYIPTWPKTLPSIWEMHWIETDPPAPSLRLRLNCIPLPLVGLGFFKIQLPVEPICFKSLQPMVHIAVYILWAGAVALRLTWEPRILTLGMRIRQEKNLTPQIMQSTSLVSKRGNPKTIATHEVHGGYWSVAFWMHWWAWTG